MMSPHHSRQRLFLWASLLLLVSAAVWSGACMSLLTLPGREPFRIWEEQHGLLVVLIGAPALVFLIEIVALLASVGSSGRSSTGELDVLLGLKRRGQLLRGSQSNRASIARIGPMAELARPQDEASESDSGMPGTVLDRLVERKRQGALSPYPTRTPAVPSTRITRLRTASKSED
jgi:hypothetical protein